MKSNRSVLHWRRSSSARCDSPPGTGGGGYGFGGGGERSSSTKAAEVVFVIGGGGGTGGGEGGGGGLTGIFFEDLELAEFPFDVQCLSLTVRMWGAGVEATQSVDEDRTLDRSLREASPAAS